MRLPDNFAQLANLKRPRQLIDIVKLRLTGARNYPGLCP